MVKLFFYTYHSNMIYILLSILSSTSIFLIFKFVDLKKLSSLNVIVVNYFIAGLLGFSLYHNKFIGLLSSFDTNSYILSVTIGVFFFIGFLLIGKTIQTSGLSITSVASKMSVVIPIIFSILFDNEAVGLFKILGIVLALVSIFMIVYNKDDSKKNRAIITPILLFVFMGIVDSLVKYSQSHIFNKDVNAVVFTSLLFSFALITSIIYYLFKINTNKKFDINTFYFGSALGIVNFGSIYFLIKALDENVFNSSVVFGINNTSIVVFSILIGLLFFKEKISKLNFAGIVVSIIAILILTNLE